MKLDITPGCALSVLTGELIPANTLVVFDANGAAVIAGAGSKPEYIVYDAAASGTYVAAYELEGRVYGRCKAAITTGNYVKAGAEGKFVVEASATTPTAFTLGQAVTTTSTDNDPIYVVAS
jgi:hypothetical protein